MRAYVKNFWVPKRGNSPGEYEDAFWVGSAGTSEGDLDQSVLRLSLADGASESLLANRWAKLLVSCFGKIDSAATTAAGFMAAYSDATTRWNEELEGYKADREARGAPIHWYEEPGLAKGAYATILAVEFRDDPEGGSAVWTASSLGDSCLFQIRDELLHRSFPMSEASAFSSQPPLLPSRPADEAVLLRHACLTASDWLPGDSFYLATDALAAWFLREIEQEGCPWAPLRDLDTSDALLDFPEWVDQQRDLGRMQNDDTTLLRIDIL